MEKFKLIHQPSPLHKMRGNYVDGVNIFIKRDDLLEFGLGGNKVRL